MQRLEVSCAVRPIYRSLGFKGLIAVNKYRVTYGNLTSLKQTVLSCFSNKFTFIYTKLKLKTCHTRCLSFKNDIGKMATVFLDAVFKPFFFFKSSKTRANN